MDIDLKSCLNTSKTSDVDKSHLSSSCIPVLPFHKTRSVIAEFQTLLSCQICKNPPVSPISMTCEHSFCSSCIKKKTDNCCPICNIPTLPCDRKPDNIIRCLTESCQDLITLFNGGSVQLNFKGHEAPESAFEFSHKNIATEEVSQLKNDVNFEGFQPRSTGSTRERNTKPKSLNAKGKKISKKTSIATSRSSSASNVSKVVDAVEISPKRENAIVGQEIPKTPKLTSSRIPEFKTPNTPAINKRNSKGETLLHTLCIKGCLEKVKSLLEDGAHPNTKDNAGWTPLHEACNHGFVDVASELLKHGAYVDVPGPNNETPLHDAVTAGFTDVIKLLRRWGANDQIRDLLGKTPRSLADMCKSPGDIHSSLDEAKDDSLCPKVLLEPYPKKMVLIESKLSPSYKKIIEKVAKLLKVKLVNDFSSDVTHVVVWCDQETAICQRTAKFMMGVVSGKWIVTQKWLDACLQLGGPANPEEFEVVGSKNIVGSYAPKRSRLNALKMNPGLFNGCHIYLSGISGGEGVPSKKDLETLIKVGNGVNLQREPNPENIEENEQTVPFHVTSPSDPLWKCSHYCIYQEGINEPKLKYDMNHIKSLPLSWLLDSADNFSLIPPYK